MDIASVLIAGLHPAVHTQGKGGVWSWQQAVAAAFRRRGVSTHLWTPRASLAPVYDLGIINEPVLGWKGVAARCRRVVFVCHGRNPAEKPAAAPTVYTSPEVRDFWGADKSAPIVRQPIDLGFWSPPERDDARQPVLVAYSNYAPADWNLASHAAAAGLSFERARGLSHEEARDLFRRAGCVLAAGRGALEAMACGAPTLIGDWRAYDGPPRYDPDTDRAEARNYSARGGPLIDHGLPAAIRAAMDGDRDRHWRRIADRHDADRIIDELERHAGTPCSLS